MPHFQGDQQSGGPGKKIREPDERIPGKMELEALRQKVVGYQT